MSTRTTPVVLVADDEPSMLALVARHVRTLGYEVLEASDGEAAWREAENSLPDLVVLDVMMPGMSGWEVCRRIRENVGLHHTGVIMLTGIGQSLNELTSPLYGADAYIDKPFEFKDLDEQIREVLVARGHEPIGVEPPPPPSVDPEYSSDSIEIPDDEESDDADQPAARSWSEPLPSFNDYDPETRIKPIEDDGALAPIDELATGRFIREDEEDEFSMAVTLRPPPPAHAAPPPAPPSPLVDPEHEADDDGDDDDEDEPITQRPVASSLDEDADGDFDDDDKEAAEEPKPRVIERTKRVAKKTVKTVKKAASTAAKKAPKKAATKKAPKKAATKKAPKKAAAKKAPKKAPAKKAPKKAATKKAPKKAAAKKAPKKAPAKKAATQSPAKKAAKKPAKKAKGRR